MLAGPMEYERHDLSGRLELFVNRQLRGLTLAASCMVLTMVALLAAYVPARRASRIDPIAALRED